MFCRMGFLHLCRPQGRYGRGQNGPWRSCISCEWLKACVLPLFSLPRFSPECCILVAFVSLHSHLNNAFCKRKIMTDYCSELAAHRRCRSHLCHRFTQKLLQPEGRFKNKWCCSHDKCIYSHRQERSQKGDSGCASEKLGVPHLLSD